MTFHHPRSTIPHKVYTGQFKLPLHLRKSSSWDRRSPPERLRQTSELSELTLKERRRTSDSPSSTRPPTAGLFQTTTRVIERTPTPKATPSLQWNFERSSGPNSSHGLIAVHLWNRRNSSDPSTPYGQLASGPRVLGGPRNGEAPPTLTAHAQDRADSHPGGVQYVTPLQLCSRHSDRPPIEPPMARYEAEWTCEQRAQRQHAA